MKKLRTFIVEMSILACGIAGAFYGITWAENVFSFITIALGIAILLGSLSGEARERNINSYFKTPSHHLPAWFDYIYYIAIISVCAAVTWYVSATCWLLIGAFDAHYRSEAEKIKEKK